ncbi:acetolactate synthase 3 large subunit, partial [Rhizobium ruizarguesonis]
MIDEASRLLREFVDLTGFPVTSNIIGLGAYTATGPNWLRVAGQDGSHEANMEIGECDLMVAIGARFDDLAIS